MFVKFVEKLFEIAEKLFFVVVYIAIVYISIKLALLIL
jgi:hypothetical protein